jgi:asparaginyl-tRNA synthetase
MSYQRNYISSLLTLQPGQKVSAKGWVKTRRDSKNVHFVQVNDGSCFQDLQVVVPAGVIEEEILRKVTVGACVCFEGELVESPAAGQAVELRADSLILYGPADPQEYPLQKKGASFEFLREIAHLRARGNTFGAVFRIRSKAAWAIHKFFQERGFHYVHTPIITPSDCEGAGELFYVTTALKRDENGYLLTTRDPAEDFFGRPTFLTVSGQLEAETLVHGLTNVYTFGPTFRAENSNSVRHLAEFWMIEPEMAFCELEGNMILAEEFLKEVIQYLLDHCAQDLEFFNKRIEPRLFETLDHVVHSPFERITYTEAIKMLESSRESFEFPAFWGAELQSEHERWLTEKKIGKPVFVTDYPKEIKAFYMRLNDDGKTVRGMDTLVPRIGEILGGAQREERLDVLKKRIQEQGLHEQDYWWYLDMRRFGSAPHSGFGLGFERFLMYVTGMKNIRDVIPYFRTPGHAEF